MTEEQWPEVFICPICGKSGGTTTVRQSFIDTHRFVVVPPKAIVHVKCDEIEQKRLKQGKLKLSDLWEQTQ